MDGYELVRSLRDAEIPFRTYGHCQSMLLMICVWDFVLVPMIMAVKPVNINELVFSGVGSTSPQSTEMINERKQRIGDTILSAILDGFPHLLGKYGTSSERIHALIYTCFFFRENLLPATAMDDIWGYDSASDAHTVDVHIEGFGTLSR